MKLASLQCAFLVAALLSGLLAISDSPQAAEQKAILVTGASTGIGRNIAERLAADGHFVYAGARTAADIAALNAIENIQGIRLDVTVQTEIDAAVAHITAEGRGLYGLVNNAGVGVLFPLIEVDEVDMQFQMDVNLFGPYRVTRAFAPLIIESKGRITTTGSISGILSGFLAGPYSMSKHAMEAYTDSLASEMEKFGVAVSIVEPGNYDSAIYGTLLKRMEQRNQTGQGTRYEEEISRFIERASNRPADKSPNEVSAAVVHAMFDENPKRRYMVVPNENQARITIEKAIEELVQLNEGHQYSYDREELIELLDAALAGTTND